tara:strand:+ start:645 stop:1352 length:708 start_codon:yes stop_codon:yes gene_type:complete
MSSQPLFDRRTKVRLRRLSSTFLAGLLAVLPIMITAAVVMWLIGAAESLLGGLLNAVLPGPLYLPGMGLILAVLLIFLVGIGVRGVVFRQVLAWIEAAMNRIPLVKTVYGAVRDLTGLMSGDSNRRFSQVVTVQLPNMPIRLVGFVTVEDLAGSPMAGEQDEVAVYLPMSYQIGGYTLLLPRALLTPLDLGFEEAMRFVITAGLSRTGEGAAPTAPPPPPAAPPPTTAQPPPGEA